MTINLIEIYFAKLLIEISPAIARMDNLDNHNLGNNLTTTIVFIIIFKYSITTIIKRTHVSIISSITTTINCQEL